MRVSIYEMSDGAWTFDAPAPNRLAAPPRAVALEVPDGAKFLREEGERLLHSRVGGKDKLVSAEVAVSCARRGLHGFRRIDGGQELPQKV